MRKSCLSRTSQPSEFCKIPSPKMPLDFKIFLWEHALGSPYHGTDI